MTTPPRVTTTELDAAVERITHRHRKLDDPATELLGIDPRDVLDHLRKRPTPGLPGWVTTADLADSLTLHNWLWWEDRRRLLATLRAGRRHGMSLTQLGTPLGIRTRQGTRDLEDRLEALLRYDRPDEKLTRAARRAAVADNDDARAAWIAEHADEFRDVATALLTTASVYLVEDREWVDELAVDLDGDHLTPATLAVLGLATAEVRTAPGVAALDTWHGVHTAMAAADQLRAEYARI